jgi:hypothetical protein
MTRDHVTLRSVPDIPDCPHCKTPMRLIGASPSEVPKIRMETRVFVFRRRSPVGSRPVRHLSSCLHHSTSRARIIAGLSSRARRRDKVWPPSLNDGQIVEYEGHSNPYSPRNSTRPSRTHRCSLIAIPSASTAI